MIEKNVSLVGWYHSHPKFPAHPTLRDCDAQLDYQIKMRGPSDATYSPCVGVICCKFYFYLFFHKKMYLVTSSVRCLTTFS